MGAGANDGGVDAMGRLILPRRKVLLGTTVALITSPADIRKAIAQILLTGAGRSGAAVTPVSVDQATTIANGAVGANIDVTMTVSSGATLLLAMVFVRGIQSSISGGTCTWDPAGANQALTLIGTIANTDGGSAGASQQSTALYGLVSPTAGASKILRIATTNTFATSIAGISFFNTKTVLGNAVINFAKASSAAAASITGSITAAANNMGLAVEHCNNALSSTVSISGTYAFGTKNDNIRSAYGYGSGSVSQTMTGNVSGDNYLSIAAEIVAGP